jgi:hypothetical protein
MKEDHCAETVGDEKNFDRIEFSVRGYVTISGFGGLVVSMLASGTQVRGFAPDRSRRIFPARKIHSMLSFGGEVKIICPMSQHEKELNNLRKFRNC